MSKLLISTLFFGLLIPATGTAQETPLAPSEAGPATDKAPAAKNTNNEIRRRKNKPKARSLYVPLEDQPAVRNRILFVRKRFELGLALESSIGADYRHVFGGGLKAEYHLTDHWSIGGLFLASAGVNTGLTDQILGTLDGCMGPDSPSSDPCPTREQYESHLNDNPLRGAVYVGFTPIYGKLAGFGKFFVHFDFYFQAGMAFASLSTNCNDTICSDTAPGVAGMGETVDTNFHDDPALNDGTRLGLYFGGGMHLFFNDWIALDLTIRDYVFNDNPSGLDTNYDFKVSDEDSSFKNHLFFGLGLSFMLPSTAKRTP